MQNYAPTKVTAAFEAVPRANFIPEENISNSDADIPLPIGYGQTISQPTTVRLMLTWLGAKAGNKVLDIGSGSGWTSALLSKIVGKEGKVFAVEIIPELLELGKGNCDRLGIKNIDFFQAEPEIVGLPTKGLFKRILVNASAKELPGSLLDQLDVGGTLVAPVKNDVLEITKLSGYNFKTTVHPGFIFVPLIHNKA